MLLRSMNFLFERQDKTNGRMTPQALNKSFLITVRKKEHNEEYEPNSLRTFWVCKSHCTENVCCA